MTKICLSGAAWCSAPPSFHEDPCGKPIRQRHGVVPRHNVINNVHLHLFQLQRLLLLSYTADDVDHPCDDCASLAIGFLDTSSLLPMATTSRAALVPVRLCLVRDVYFESDAKATSFLTFVITYSLEAAMRTFRFPMWGGGSATPWPDLLADVLTRVTQLAWLELWPERMYPPYFFDALINHTPALTRLRIESDDIEWTMALQGIKGLSAISLIMDPYGIPPEEVAFRVGAAEAVIADNADTLEDVSISTICDFFEIEGKRVRLVLGETSMRTFNGIQELSFAILVRNPDAHDSAASSLWQVLGSVPHVRKLDLQLDLIFDRTEFIHLASLTPDTMPRSYAFKELTSISLLIDASLAYEDIQGFAKVWFSACPNLTDIRLHIVPMEVFWKRHRTTDERGRQRSVVVPSRRHNHVPTQIDDEVSAFGPRSLPACYQEHHSAHDDRIYFRDEEELREFSLRA
ncbi:hypothetical protein EVG20_g2829 [Dentipellis fragilis]|uniref:F-box domain-containing protein n=1 Tax=Dentipellis fragilis TaxID=205917 RepID=A0A4Y9Z6L8_9AGAM|nr:hypothetical protein EVG20_g2829 [Dentipellis fragilis]